MLRLSKKTDYGLLALSYLANEAPSGAASARAIAERYEIPVELLAKVLQHLARLGFVVAQKGAHGGYQLARAPEAIPMSEVLRALEGPLAPMICATEDDAHDACARTSSCTVNYLWIRVRDAVAGALDGVTLADLVPQRVVSIQPSQTPTAAIEGALTTP